MAEGTHAYPSRTRPLRPPAPMILGVQTPGKVGRRQAREKDREGSPVLTHWVLLLCAENDDGRRGNLGCGKRLNCELTGGTYQSLTYIPLLVYENSRTPRPIYSILPFWPGYYLLRAAKMARFCLEWPGISRLSGWHVLHNA